MIIVHQIILTGEEIDQINSGKSLPKYTAKMQTMFGAENFNSDNFKFYTPAFQVSTDDLDVAFEITNLWDSPELVKSLGDKGHSSSVGDIFQKGDRYFMVNNFGFQELYFFSDEPGVC